MELCYPERNDQGFFAPPIIHLLLTVTPHSNDTQLHNHNRVLRPVDTIHKILNNAFAHSLLF